jgi:hypothetical protein
MPEGSCLGTVEDDLNGKRFNREIILIDHGIPLVVKFH